MTIINDDDLRSMFRAAADGAPLSPDAWKRIEHRIDVADLESGRSRRPLQLVVGGAAAAAVAAVAVAQLVPGAPTSQVAARPTPAASHAEPGAPAAGLAEVPDTPWVWPAARSEDPAMFDPRAVAAAYLQDRTGAAPEGGAVRDIGDGRRVVLFGAGPVMSEVTVVQAGRRWFVEFSGSDLLPLHMLTYDGRNISGELTAEAEGLLTLRYGGGDTTPLIEEPFGPVSFRQSVTLDRGMPGEGWVTAGGVLETADGTFAVTEGWQRNPDASAVPDTAPDEPDAYAGVYPAYTGEELTGFEDAARSGRDTTYADARSTAGAFLGDMLFPRGRSEVTYTVGEPRLGDRTSGEVPFTLSDGGRGVIVVRKHSAAAHIWYVVAAYTEPALAIDVRVESGGVTVELEDGARVEVAEMQPLPGGDLVSGELTDDLLRFEDVTDGIVKLVGVDASDATAFLFLRVASAG